MEENKHFVNNKSSSQVVLYPLLAMTEVKRFLWVFTRLLVLSSTHISRAVLFWGSRSATTFSSSKDFLWGWDLQSGSATPGPPNASYKATPSLPGWCARYHCHAERPSHDSPSAPSLMEGFHSKCHDKGLIHSFLYTDQWPFADKQHEAWCFHPRASQ